MFIAMKTLSQTLWSPDLPECVNGSIIVIRQIILKFFVITPILI